MEIKCGREQEKRERRREREQEGEGNAPTCFFNNSKVNQVINLCRTRLQDRIDKEEAITILLSLKIKRYRDEDGKNERKTEKMRENRIIPGR